MPWRDVLFVVPAEVSWGAHSTPPAVTEGTLKPIFSLDNHRPVQQRRSFLRNLNYILVLSSSFLERGVCGNDEMMETEVERLSA
jgi:hypothetical protein